MHMLETRNGKVSMAYAYRSEADTPWHKLGTKVSNDLTPHQMMVAAGLDWRVERVPLFADYNDKKVQTRAEALIRDVDGEVLSIVTDTWNPVQNEEAFEFFHEYVMAGDMEMDTAGSLRGGKHIWALAKMKDSFFEIFGGDRTEGYLLFSNPHQFGKGITIQMTGIRTVCQNTITMALNSGSKTAYKASHRRAFDADQVKETMGIATSKLEQYKEAMLFLGSKQAKGEDIVTYLNRIFPVTSGAKAEEGKIASLPARKVFDVLESQPGANFAEGTWYQALNAVTYYTNHLAGRSADNRVSSLWFGVNRDKNINAVNLALEMANAS